MHRKQANYFQNSIVLLLINKCINIALKRHVFSLLVVIYSIIKHLNSYELCTKV